MFLIIKEQSNRKDKLQNPSTIKYHKKHAKFAILNVSPVLKKTYLFILILYYFKRGWTEF